VKGDSLERTNKRGEGKEKILRDEEDQSMLVTYICIKTAY
jgi:hypothetical protein